MYQLCFTQSARHLLPSVLADEDVAVALQLEVKAAFCLAIIITEKEIYNHSYNINQD